MSDELHILTRFPVPPFGLRCPICKHGLDGLPDDLCPECGERFDLGDLIAEALPHSQEARREAIRILASQASPDCPVGEDLVVFFAASDQYGLHEAAETATRIARQRQEGAAADPDHQAHAEDIEARALASPPGVPLLTGYELPVPDLGLHCRQCSYPLRGLPSHVCPECGTTFDPAALLGTEPALRVCPVESEVEYAHVKSVLEARGIPHLLETTDVLGDTLKMRVASRRTVGRVTVPREYYFDALFWLRRAAEADRSCCSDECEQAPAPDQTGSEWACPNCAEAVPAGFDMCWNCCTMRP